jgi:hypothetical protein
MNAAKASIQLTEMITQTDSPSHLTRYDDFLRDATVEKEGIGVCINAAKSDPETEYKHNKPGMTSDVSNLTAMSIQVLDAESLQLQDVEAMDYPREKCEVLHREMVNLQELSDDNNEITSLEDICDKREALAREIMELQYLKNEFKENEDNEMISLEDSCEEHQVQGKEILTFQKLGDDNTDNGRILEDPCKKCEAHGTLMIELQEDYNENEQQDGVECVSSSAKKETSNVRKALSKFLTDFNSKHTDTAETSEHVSHKMPSNGITHSKCDNRKQQEEAIEEEVNRDDKETTVTEHEEEQTEMSVHTGNTLEAGKYSSEGKIKRYVNCSLELQLINQDNINETQSNV